MIRSLGVAVTIALGFAVMSPPEHLSAQRGPSGPRGLAWVDRDGTLGAAIGQPQDTMSGVSISPDETRIVVRGRENGRDDIYVHDVASGAKTQLTDYADHARHPMWSPDGRQIAFFRYIDDVADVFVMSADGSDVHGIFTAPYHEYHPGWSSDGRYLVVHTHHLDTDARDIWYVDFAGDQTPTPVVRSANNKSVPRLSPDGRYVAYQENIDDRWEVSVAAFPSGDRTWQVSTGGGVWPRWAGDELFYWEDETLVAVTVTEGAAAGEGFGTGRVERLFSASDVGMDPPARSLFNPLYDVTADGRRFVVVRAVSAP